MYNLFLIGDLRMARSKGIRGLAADEGIPLNNRQLKQFREYGLLPDRPEGESDPSDLQRLKQILEAAAKAQTLDRRLFYLHDSEFSIETRFVRRAVYEVASKIRTPVKKNRALYRCLQLRSTRMQAAQEVKSIPDSWRLQEQYSWSDILSWLNDDEFRSIYEWCRSEIIALAYVPGMRESEDFLIAPFEEMVVLLLLHQLSIPPQSAIVAATEAEPWP